MKQYLDLLQRIVIEGEDVPTGAYLPGEGRRPHARFLLAAQFRHDLAAGFPAVTTKRLYFENVVKELLWFLRGETSVKTLGCGIWNSWAGTHGRPEGECGPIYGQTWRRWQYAEVDRPWDADPATSQTFATIGEFDQIGQVVADLRAVRADPYDRARRRIVLSGWNPPDIARMGLPPCHTLAQFLPAGDRLHCVCHWRSIDMFTGFPFNVAQYPLLVHLLCAVTGFRPGVFVANIADCHIYDNQLPAVREQLMRTPRPATARLELDPEVARLAPDLTVAQCRLLTPELFTLADYAYDHRPLRAEVAV